MSVIDCSPNVGEQMNEHPHAFIIAKHLVAQRTDMNEYKVLCLYKNDSDRFGPEYVVWSMYAREDKWSVEAGSYFNAYRDPEAIGRAVECYLERAGLKERSEGY